jgi:hypothetical protein
MKMLMLEEVKVILFERNGGLHFGMIVFALKES